MRKVIVAMSGGIDSSVSALLLKEQGYDVTGVTLRLFDKEQKIKCCGSDESIETFKKICNQIGIKYYIKDARKIFDKYVIKNFVSSYLNAFTPNPCVECNRILKFDYFFKIAKLMEADYIATGHYARIINENGEYKLIRGIDPHKDQSYFLYPIKREYLKYILFPVGEMKKIQVKEIAKKHNLPLNINKESKDICFIPEGNYVLWMKKHNYTQNIDGYIKDINGKILGKHKGFFYYTIGQRKNLGISYRERLYVVDIIPEENAVIVGTHIEAMFKGVILKNVNWLVSNPPKINTEITAQIRYRHTPQPGKIIKITENNVEFHFDKKQFAPAKGQSCVFYEGDRVIGGGIIYETIR